MKLKYLVAENIFSSLVIFMKLCQFAVEPLNPPMDSNGPFSVFASAAFGFQVGLVVKNYIFWHPVLFIWSFHFCYVGSIKRKYQLIQIEISRYEFFFSSLATYL